MKKQLLILLIGCVLTLSYCKKSSTCWECADSQGNDFKTTCSSKEVKDLKNQGYTCNEK